MLVIVACYYFYNAVDHYYLFKTLIDPQVVKNMFENFKSTYDFDEAPTFQELEDWLDVARDIARADW